MTTLIVDAGSTKTTWLLTGSAGGKLARVTTAGLNPSVMSADAISSIVGTEVIPVFSDYRIDRLHYYGAGVVSDKAACVVEQALEPLGCRDLTVASDMLGAARALLGREAGIACILGTGSNSCLYDGSRIVANVPPLGFILGDEASGAVIAKRFVGDLFKGLLPQAVMDEWICETGLSMSDVIDRVYRRPCANAFLASHMPLIIRLSCYDAVGALIENELSNFFARNVTLYDTDVRTVGFVGSLAVNLSERLHRVAGRFGYTVHSIVGNPIDSLALYHAENEKI